MKRIPRLIRLISIIVLSYLGLFTLFRLGFWLAFSNPDDPLPAPTLVESLYLGLKFDLRLVLLMVLPMLLTGWLRPLNPFGGFGRRLWSAYLTLAFLTALLFYVADFGYFSYLHIRLDATILRFLSNPAISFQMVWESYPVVLWSVVLLSATAAYAWGLGRLLEQVAAQPYIRLPRWRHAAVVSVSVFAVLFGIYGKLSWYPLRWSDAFFSPHAFASSVALNPVLYFYDTYLNGGVEYDEEVVRSHYGAMADYLGADPKDKAALNFAREVTAEPRLSGKPNVIMVFLESFASYKAGLSGNPLDPTPHIDRLAREGIYFPNFFTPHTGTARSVFAAITGIPDVQIGDTSSRNPRIVDQHTLVNALEGYEKFYFLGGSANWRNIRGLLSHNIPGLRMYEEGSYSSPRIDVWGISDLDLFKEANSVLKGQQAPFFAIIQTAGNHRPYTIPEDNHGFELRQADQEKLLQHGFESEAEFNSFRFMDHSVGYFIEQAQQAPYFKNTVFIFYGDHGISGNAGVHVPKQESQLEMGSYRVPLVIYAPELLKPSVQEKVASEVDLLPTIAGLVAGSYRNTTFGRDLLDKRYDDRRFAFTINHSQVPNIGLIGPKFYFRMRADGSNRALHPLNTDNPRTNLLEQYPQQAARMEALTAGIYQAAKYVMNNNPNELSVKVAAGDSGGQKP